MFIKWPDRATESAVKGRLTIFYAAGLNASMDEMIKEFKKQYPSKEVIGESSGTLLAIRKITELKKEADILFAADAESIKNMLIPQYADWYLTFYRDRVVLAYTERSKYTNEINAQNWYKILLRKDVRFGYANPDQAPIGYRTLMCRSLRIS
jgi:molybdate/tungstate transport system substrate-binding protein